MSTKTGPGSQTGQPVGTPARDAFHRRLAERQTSYLERLQALLRLPGFSATGEGIRESAEACLAELRSVAPDARLVETGGHPVVYGRSSSSRVDAKTLVVYALYDQVPIGPDKWTVDPLGAEIIDASVLGLDPRLGELICARAACNHRGPMLAAIMGAGELLAAEGDLPCNILWIWEGEEEIGSPHLPEFIASHEAELAGCAGLWLPSMFQEFDGPMPLYRGCKGLTLFELECRGGEWGGTLDGRHTWPGWLPFVDAPMMMLIQAVASLYDADHNVTIDGLSESIPPLHEEDRLQLEQLQRDADDGFEAAIKRSLNVKTLRGGKPIGDHIHRWVADPGLNVQGITGGYTGLQFYSMMPQSAAAKIDIRVPEGVASDRLLALIRSHLDRRGFDAVSIKSPVGYDGLRSSVEDEVCQASIRAAATLGVPSTIWPTFNACAPTSLFTQAPLALPSCASGIGHGGNAHAPDEYICVQALSDLMAFTGEYLHEWAGA